MKKAIILPLAGLFAVSPVCGDWSSFKEKAQQLGSDAVDISKDAWNSTVDWSKSAAEASSQWITEQEAKLNTMLAPKTPQEARTALDTMANVALAKLFKQHAGAKKLFDSAYGYAVFDSRRFSFIVHANGGSGVAINQKTGQRTYMSMLGGGLALGIGGTFYQQIIVFQDKKTFDNFVDNGWNKGWEGSAGMSAIAWNKGAELSSRYNGGLAVFVLNDKGLLLDATISGSKYWQDDELNKK
ncbi:hypothetical protein [Candidatus Sororendozoicomonas aggregata]|uniref:hypothetical protein n=1 Tax=Candidatus Sororendozoicomonas aggregata TaxID=3073239 RepID=UPI002ED3E09E